MLVPWLISNPDLEMQAASLVRVISWSVGAWRGVPECHCMNCGSLVTDGWHVYFKLFQNYVIVLAAATIRSQLYDQHQYLLGIFLCLSYTIVIVRQIRGRRYNVQHNTVQKLALNCLCGHRTVCCLCNEQRCLCLWQS
jgi:hypothetical protein